MDDALGMSRIERLGHVGRDPDDAIDRQRGPGDRLFQRLPLEELEHEEAAAVVLAGVVQRADVRMVQRRDQLGFAPEPLQRLW